MKKILVISPHPDDEVIGCGGTLAKYISNGSKVDIIFLTSGEKGVKDKNEEETRMIRENEANLTARLMGFQKIEFWKEEDGNFEISKKLITKLLNYIKTNKPEIVFVTHPNEQHPDHKEATKLVKETMIQLPPEFKKTDILMYEVWTPLQDMDLIEDISDYMDLKIKAVQTYKSQCDILKFDEAILGLNRYRGEMHSWPGGEYAEVFKLMKL